MASQDNTNWRQKMNSTGNFNSTETVGDARRLRCPKNVVARFMVALEKL